MFSASCEVPGTLLHKSESFLTRSVGTKRTAGESTRSHPSSGWSFLEPRKKWPHVARGAALWVESVTHGYNKIQLAIERTLLVSIREYVGTSLTSVAASNSAAMDRCNSVRLIINLRESCP